MRLTSRRIRERVKFDPFPEYFNLCSVDLTLASRTTRLLCDYPNEVIKPHDDVKHLDQDHLGSIVIKPHEFLLGLTMEQVTVPCDLVGVLDGKSSLARLGLLVHLTASTIDPGFCGNIVLEIYNLGPRPVELQVGQRVCAIGFYQLSEPVESGYNGSYQGQIRPWAGRIDKTLEGV